MSDLPDHNPTGRLGAGLSADETDPYEDIDNGGDSRTEAPTGDLRNERFVGDAQLREVLSGTPLAVGSKGSGVKRVQQAMVDMGFALPGAADGSFGKKTAKAVSNFQVNASKAFSDVAVSGEVDASTLRALDDLAPPPGKKGQTKNVPPASFDGKKVRVIVLKDEHRTFLFDRKGHVQTVFMNAVGAKATPTTDGLKVIVSKLDENGARAEGERLWGAPVFGARIVNLSWADGKPSGEELHGTTAPDQLGEDVSHGCVRHNNPDIIAIYDSVTVGEKVAIVASLADPRLKEPG